LSSGLHLTLIDHIRPRTINRHNGLLYLLRTVLHKGRAPRTSHSNSFVSNWLISSIVASMLTINQSTDTNVKPFKCFTCHMSFARRYVIVACHDTNIDSTLIDPTETSYKDITQYTVVMQTNKKSQQ
jgi:hypothetical protein